MITLIHGDNIATSRDYYKSLQKKDSLVFDGEKIVLDDIVQALQTTSLFGEEKSICIENFFSKRKASKEVDSIVAAVKKAESQHEIILWETKPLTKKNPFPESVVKPFMLPQSLFSFLDALKPHNTEQVLRLYHQSLQHTEPEVILSMLFRQIRLMLTLSDTKGGDTIDDLKRLSPWQQKKLLSQARFFTPEELQQLHASLFELDVKSKTGGLAMPLDHTIDFLLIAI